MYTKDYGDKKSCMICLDDLMIIVVTMLILNHTILYKYEWSL